MKQVRGPPMGLAVSIKIAAIQQKKTRTLR